jgi:anti-anti-sigma factor
MIGTVPNPINTAILTAGELTELVRGQEQSFLAQFTPLVRRQNVTLDLGSVMRIDAAGIAALISLYASAHETGHCFTVVNTKPRVAEILLLVGLEQLLVSHNTVRTPYFEPRYIRPAA